MKRVRRGPRWEMQHGGAPGPRLPPASCPGVHPLTLAFTRLSRGPRSGARTDSFVLVNETLSCTSQRDHADHLASQFGTQGAQGPPLSLQGRSEHRLSTRENDGHRRGPRQLLVTGPGWRPRQYSPRPSPRPSPGGRERKQSQHLHISTVPFVLYITKQCFVMELKSGVARPRCVEFRRKLMYII